VHDDTHDRETLSGDAAEKNLKGGDTIEVHLEALLPP